MTAITAHGKPFAYDLNGFAHDDLIDFTPELRAEGEKAIARGVSGEIDEDVDRIVSDGSGQCIVAQTSHIAPMLDLAAQALGDGVRRGMIGVTEKLELRRGAASEDRLGVMPRNGTTSADVHWRRR